MNRREFILTASAAAAGTTLLADPILIQSRTGLAGKLLNDDETAAKANKGVHWPIGCFNRPWHEKADWGLDTALDGIKAAGYKIVGLLRGGKDELLTGAKASQEYLEKLKARIAQRGLTVNMAALRAA